jgi:hypothetical protein
MVPQELEQALVVIVIIKQWVANLKSIEQKAKRTRLAS